MRLGSKKAQYLFLNLQIWLDSTIYNCNSLESQMKKNAYSSKDYTAILVNLAKFIVHKTLFANAKS